MEWQTKNETNEHIAHNFETLNYDPSESSGKILLDSSCDSDLHFFNTSVQNLNTPYIILKKFQHFLDEDISESFSILDLNIRSIEILFETFKNLLSALNFNFSIMFF